MLDRTPRVFISYSWTSMEFQERVRELAESLRQDGIDVKLDIWDLKDGQDKYAFMEQCVTDPDIDKVLIICDSGYAAKADRRQGGVGDETTIISAEVYGHAAQEKFVPVIMERDEHGEPYMPAYLKAGCTAICRETDIRRNIRRLSEIFMRSRLTGSRSLEQDRAGWMRRNPVSCFL